MLTLIALFSTALAANGYIPVQGVLTDSSGIAVDGTVEVTFRMTTDATGATSIWTDTFDVDVVDGRFATELGGSLPLDLATFANYPGAHLGIQVTGDSEMPLVPLDHVPYAAWSESAGDASTLQGMSLSDLRSEIPLTSDIESAARNVCYDTPGELTAALDADYAYTAGTGLALNTLEFSVDQTTVEGWTSAQITTHAGVANAHHTPYTDSDASALITTHSGIANAHHTPYTDSDASALITTHAGVANAHHTPYTDSDASALITTHAGVANAHHTPYTDSDASALITTHTGIADAHHAPYTDADAISAMSGGAVSVGTGTLSFGGGTTAALPTGWEMGMAGSDNAVIYGAHETGTELSTLFITAGDNVGTDKIFLGGGAICCSSTPFLGLEVNTNGNARLSGTLSSGQNALYADVAENVPTMSGTEAGDVVSVQATAGAYGETPFVKASSAYDPRVVGVISDSAILTMATEDARQPLALTGLVKVKVDAGYGAIKPGDLLTSSPTNGHAMRADEDVPGTIIGKALEPLDHGTGRVLMLVMPR